MQVPLVRERLDLSVRSDFRSASRILAGSRDDDAVRVSLENTNALGTALQTPRAGGYLDGFLKNISSLAERMRDTADRLAGDMPSGAQRAALTEDLTALQEEFGALTRSRDFQSLLQKSQAVAETLAGGAAPAQVAQALAGDGGLFGDGYLNAVQGGYVSRLNSVNSVLSEIAGMTSDSLGSGAAIARLAELARSAQVALDVAPAAAVHAETLEPAEIAPVVELPQMVTYRYHNSKDMTLTLKGFSGRDLLKAAVLGAADAEHASYLALELPPPDKKESEEEHRTKTGREDRLKELAPQGPLATSSQP